MRGSWHPSPRDPTMGLAASSATTASARWNSGATTASVRRATGPGCCWLCWGAVPLGLVVGAVGDWGSSASADSGEDAFLALLRLRLGAGAASDPGSCRDRHDACLTARNGLVADRRPQRMLHTAAHNLTMTTHRGGGGGF